MNRFSYDSIICCSHHLIVDKSGLFNSSPQTEALTKSTGGLTSILLNMASTPACTRNSLPGSKPMPPLPLVTTVIIGPSACWSASRDCPTYIVALLSQVFSISTSQPASAMDRAHHGCMTHSQAP